MMSAWMKNITLALVFVYLLLRIEVTLVCLWKPNLEYFALVEILGKCPLFHKSTSMTFM